MQDKVKAGYNKAARAYSKGRDQFKNDKYLDRLDSLLKPNSVILDVGCGSGKPVTEFFVNHGHQVTGIDISKEQIKLAKENVPQGLFEVRDMSLLKPGEYAVDAIVSFYTIFHIPREQHLGLLKKLHTFLNDDGVLLITMGATDWEGNEEFFGVQMHWSHYGKDKNSQMVREAGFELLVDEIDDSGGEEHQVIMARKIWRM